MEMQATRPWEARGDGRTRNGLSRRHGSREASPLIRQWRRVSTQWVERTKAHVGAKVEHPFGVPKQQFGFRKTRLQRIGNSPLVSTGVPWPDVLYRRSIPGNQHIHPPGNCSRPVFRFFLSYSRSTKLFSMPFM